MSNPAGWYPQADGQQRYWDGQKWTEDFAPGAGTPVTPPVVARKNWFVRHKILTAIGAVLLLGIFASIANGGGTKSDNTAAVSKPVATSTTPDQAALDKAAADKAAADKAAADKAAADKAAADKAAADKAAAAQAAAGVYDATYGTFTTIMKSGRGDTVIALPKGVKAGIVTATHSGSSNFQISGMDKGNQSTIDGLVNEIGNYSGTTAYGLTDMGNASVKLQITADGSWTIKIAPISNARVFPASISGKGDAVFKFEGDAADFAITHNGSSNFTVQQYGGELNMGVNEIGKYSGTVPFVAGPTVLVIGADGAWTFKKQG
jgi:Protein of unknown function (DUF2510)